jgi:perosamine synthetase
MLKLSQPNISEQAITAVAEVLRSGHLVHGAEGEAFERELAQYLGCAEVLLVSSGAAALHVALLALDIGPGDAVIVPDFTFPATANVVAMVGARPVIIDVDPGTYTMSIEKLEAAVESWARPERLRAVMPVHEFGCPAEMDDIQRLAKSHGLFIVEDAACALGARYKGVKVGTLGDIGCFSFHPRKTLTTGEGGALATNDAGLAVRIRRLRNHGMERQGTDLRFVEPATNYRLTNFQAALGKKQLPHLDGWIQGRQALAQSYLTALEPLRAAGHLDVPQMNHGHSWQTFMITLKRHHVRAQVVEALKTLSIETNLGAHSLSAIGIYGAGTADDGVGRRLYSRGLALPFCEQYDGRVVTDVVEALGQALGA